MGVLGLEEGRAALRRVIVVLLLLVGGHVGPRAVGLLLAALLEEALELLVCAGVRLAGGEKKVRRAKSP